MEKSWKLDLNKPWKNQTEKMKNWILHGCTDPRYALQVQWESDSGEINWNLDHEGLIPRLTRLFMKHQTDGLSSWVSKYTSNKLCHVCSGSRLRPEARAAASGRPLLPGGDCG